VAAYVAACYRLLSAKGAAVSSRKLPERTGVSQGYALGIIRRAKREEAAGRGFFAAARCPGWPLVQAQARAHPARPDGLPACVREADAGAGDDGPPACARDPDDGDDDVPSRGRFSARDDTAAARDGTTKPNGPPACVWNAGADAEATGYGKARRVGAKRLVPVGVLLLKVEGQGLDMQGLTQARLRGQGSAPPLAVAGCVKEQELGAGCWV
jgi:hypothetical protein